MSDSEKNLESESVNNESVNQSGAAENIDAASVCSTENTEDIDAASAPSAENTESIDATSAPSAENTESIAETGTEIKAESNIEENVENKAASDVKNASESNAEPNVEKKVDEPPAWSNSYQSVEGFDQVSEDELNKKDFTYKEKKTSGVKKKTGGVIYTIVIIIAVGVFAYAAYRLIEIYTQYKSAQDLYANINDDIKVTTAENDTTAADSGTTVYTQLYDFDKLAEINPDVVGYVVVPSCGIEYPFPAAEDNSYYLTHDFNGGERWSGSIFMDYRNNANFKDSHIFLYGHHMNDGSMFAALLNYDDEEFYLKQKAADNNYFYVYTKDCVYKYEIFTTADVTFADNYDAFRLCDYTFTVKDYVDYVEQYALYDTGVTADKNDKIVTLYTCQLDSASGIRHMTQGKLIETYYFDDSDSETAATTAVKESKETTTADETKETAITQEETQADTSTEE